ALLFRAILQADSTDGAKIKDALENLKYRYDGAVTRYKSPFSKVDHNAVSRNMLFVCKVNSGRVEYVYLDDEKRGMYVRTKGR
ncbi:MAG: ABC transporter substrate-binding protein, partial [Burkholderiaceae bacterium]